MYTLAVAHVADLFIDQRRNRQAVEAVCEGLPEADGVAPLAFVVKAVNAVDRRTLVVAAQQKEILWVLDLYRYWRCV